MNRLPLYFLAILLFFPPITEVFADRYDQQAETIRNAQRLEQYQKQKLDEALRKYDRDHSYSGSSSGIGGIFVGVSLIFGFLAAMIKSFKDNW